jgi:hypothetical protein
VLPAPSAATEIRPAQGAALDGREHQSIGPWFASLCHVGGQLVSEEGREHHGAPARIGLRRAEVELLPTGIFYAQGVKANVLFFDRKPGSDTAWTRDLWIYDLRTNKHFTLKTSTLTRADLDDFVECYKPGQRAKREETERFRRFHYKELFARDKASLDIFWLRDESLEDTDNLPTPGVIAAEIVEDLEAALAEFTELAESLQGIGVDVESEE